MKVTLNEDMSAIAKPCNNGLCTGAPIKGSWFAFYDQAFKVELENGQRFIANYKYALKEYVASNPISLGAKEIHDV